MQAKKRPKWLKSLEMDMTDDNFKYDRVMSGGLIAFSLIIVQAFIATGLTDLASYISIIAFAIAIPMLAMHVFTYSSLDWFACFKARFKAPASVGISFLGGCLIDVIGLVAAFWHISWIAGLLFIMSGIVGYLVYMIPKLDIDESLNKNPLSKLE
jgi:hypothetical protein